MIDRLGSLFTAALEARHIVGGQATATRMSVDRLNCWDAIKALQLIMRLPGLRPTSNRLPEKSRMIQPEEMVDWRESESE